MKTTEDFLIEFGNAYIFNLLCKDMAFDSSSIYRIALNCKSQEIRYIFKRKLEYAKKYKNNDKPRGLGALFWNDEDEDEEEAEEQANEGFRALFG